MPYSYLIEAVQLLDPNSLDAEGAEAALNAILAMKEFNSDLFYEALHSHQGFWNSVGFTLEDSDKGSSYPPEFFKSLQEAVLQQLVQSKLPIHLNEQANKQAKQLHSAALASMQLLTYDNKTIAEINELLYSISIHPENKESMDRLEFLIGAMTEEQKDTIKKECVAFKTLHTLYQNQRGKAGRVILKVLLNDSIAIKPNDPHTTIEKINQAIDKSHDVTAFADALSEQAHNPAKAKAKLIQAISSELYNQIRALRIKDRLLVADLAERTNILSKITRVSRPLYEEQKELTQRGGARWVDFNAEILDSPAFHKQIKDNPKLKKQEYSELLENTSLILARLKRNESQLQDCINQLPESDSGAHNDVVRLRAQLLDQQKELNKSIADYQDFKSEIQKVLTIINHTTSTTEFYVYQADDITVESISQEELLNVRKKKNNVEQGDVLSGLTQDQRPKVFQKATLDAGQSFLYTVKTELQDNTVSSTSFAQSRLEAKYSAYDSKKDKLIKSSGWRIELIQGPKPQDPEHEKVNYYMSMALALLKAHGGTPSKKNPIVLKGGTRKEMELLWTALMVLGKEKFHFNQDALLVRSGSFNPNQVMAQRFFRGSVFNEQSCYHNVFCHKDAQMVLQKKLADAEELIKLQKSSAVDDKKNPSAIEDFKKQIASMKTQEILQQEKQMEESSPPNSGLST